jgi:hypothetical protein
MREKEHFLVAIAPGGKITAIYRDDLADLFAQGETKITRASSVEPAPGGGWASDLTASGGPVLGPYSLRKQALDAEIDWLESNLPAFWASKHRKVTDQRGARRAIRRLKRAAHQRNHPKHPKRVLAVR